MKKKIRILIIILIVAFIILLSVLLNMKKDENQDVQSIIENISKTDVVSTKKFMKYIDIVSGDYYMKYVIKLENEQGELEDYTIEVTIKDEDFAMLVAQENLSIIKKGNKVYYVMHDNKTVISGPVDTSTLNINGYKLNASKKLIDDSFVTTGMEKIGDDEISYYYEEYTLNAEDNTNIRYYFDNEDNLVYIKTIDSNGDEAIMKLERLEAKAYDAMFDIPSSYTQSEIS